MPVQLLNFYIQKTKYLACQMLKHYKYHGEILIQAESQITEPGENSTLLFRTVYVSKCPKGINHVTVLGEG